jgi:hypothetical protein
MIGTPVVVLYSTQAGRSADGGTGRVTGRVTNIAAIFLHVQDFIALV